MLLDLGFVTLHRPEFARSISGLLDSIRNDLIVCVWVASGLVLFSFVWFRLVWFGFAWLGLACLGLDTIDLVLVDLISPHGKRLH